MTAETPDELAKRQGWKLPGEVASAGTPALGVPSPATSAREPMPTLKKSVLGQVTDEDGAAVQTDTGPLPIVSYRLERNDPQGGREFVASVRLSGTDAVGFANRGDWMEAVGARKAAFIDASYCVNRTTGAVYKAKWRRTAGCLKAAVIMSVFAAFCILAFTALRSATLPPPQTNGSAQ